MSNVIDFMARRRAKSQESDSSADLGTGDQQVLDISEIRANEIDRDRRQVRRTILTEFISTYMVLPKMGLRKVSLYDVSQSGIAFDLNYEDGKFAVGDKVAVRIYLNKNTYFPFTTEIMNVRDITHEGVYRHGGSIVAGTVNDEALHHFIAFIESVSTTLRKDTGDVVVNGLKN